jgi:Collagen triple helix repeat (20 copies)
MFSAIRKRMHLSPSAAIATLALVFAMSGGAYAASRYVITSTKQISPKVLKALQGKAGKAGASGPAGAQGPAGAVGAKGETGATGKEGLAGKEGAPGKNGENGKEGSPWTDGGTLPSKKTETGVWVVAGTPFHFSFLEAAEASLSFNIPLQNALPEGAVHVIAAGANGAGGGTCPTTSSVSQPEAEPGNLCIFESTRKVNAGSIITQAPETGENEAAGKTGTVVLVDPETAEEQLVASGTWAVTAE